MAKRLAVHGLDRIYSSPSGRALETARPTAELLGLDINIEPWTREVEDRFSLIMPDGKKVFAFNVENTAYRTEENLNLGNRWHEAEIFDSIDAKAEYDKICACSDEFLARHGYERDGGVYRITKASDERIAVFCHGGLSSVWLSHLLNIPLHMFMAGIGISHTGVTILDFENRENGITAPYCLCLSDISHIYKENLPLKFTNSIDI
ncbi:MAG: histidine phosphatase family protein [Clostridia bacterium]|nr:histidine phosphatase family protein [Clostridia bacterium]